VESNRVASDHDEVGSRVDQRDEDVTEVVEKIDHGV
jgi:hypothetical protein